MASMLGPAAIYSIFVKKIGEYMNSHKPTLSFLGKIHNQIWRQFLSKSGEYMNPRQPSISFLGDLKAKLIWT